MLSNIVNMFSNIVNMLYYYGTHTYIYIVFNIYLYSINLWDEIFPNGNG